MDSTAAHYERADLRAEAAVDAAYPAGWPRGPAGTGQHRQRRDCPWTTRPRSWWSRGEPDADDNDGFANPTDVLNYFSPSAWINSVINDLTRRPSSGG